MKVVRMLAAITRPHLTRATNFAKGRNVSHKALSPFVGYGTVYKPGHSVNSDIISIDNSILPQHETGKEF